MICISCKNEHDENYCPKCGERKGIRKITITSIFEDALSTITDMDRGFLYNLKTLILKPKKLIFDYIQGKRKGVLNPVSFLIIAITIYLICITVFDTSKHVSEIDLGEKGSVQRQAIETGKFIRAHLKYFWILSIVPLALSLKLIFKKYNYAEYLAISSFVIGQATLVGIVSFLIFKFPLIYDPVVYIVLLWLIYKIFEDKSNKFETLLLSLAALLLFSVEFFIIILMLVFIVV